MARKKISVIGAGNVGATVAQFLATKELGDVYLFDVVDGIPEGKALDIQEGAPHWGYDLDVVGFSTSDSSNYKNMEGSDVIVVTAGMARKPGMSREDLFDKNVEIIADVSKNIKKYSPDSIIVVVSNPADIMAYALQKISGVDPQRIMGLGGSLDSSRFRTFLAKELDVSVEDVNAFVIGGHGDDMVPFIRYSSVAGIPIEKLLPKEKIDAIVKRTRFGGGEIVNYLKAGSAYYAPGISITAMVESVIKDKKRVIPCAAYITGKHAEHYGINNKFIGVPIKIGERGVEEIYDIDFLPEELELWKKSVASVEASSKNVDEWLKKHPQ
ncbi:malate dehydrogenase [Thermoplasma volcanium GSS1]|uniref:Malate dehydrogenase n=1 Tax=Thermoplasma volcanium (strain ATCC 51530 / DSM 4299 / JCM 9571 / NBRC 15438 / GSS1) TaxID=273116 RepID=MDH_THEVO|nr:malate dehydrogenase [Thermoplasma volcanium]Q979N9.1 RecName: Full=Malate dehydrogenase [Thermoplasma volcanium GSS1]BAB60263.1 malate dehydrogenase [Thermoplasma volcanium GSS1]